MEWEQILLLDINRNHWMCPPALILLLVLPYSCVNSVSYNVLHCSDPNCVRHGTHLLCEFCKHNAVKPAAHFLDAFWIGVPSCFLIGIIHPRSISHVSRCYILSARNVTLFSLCTKWCPGSFVGQTKKWLYIRINSHRKLGKNKHIHSWFTPDLTSFVLKTPSIS